MATEKELIRPEDAQPVYKCLRAACKANTGGDSAYPHRFKRSVSASCPACGYHSENAQHFLLDCPAYAHERWTLVNKSRPGEKDFAKLLSNPKTLPKVITFIHETGRFTHDRKWSRSVAGEREEAQGENTGRNTQQ